MALHFDYASARAPTSSKRPALRLRGGRRTPLHSRYASCTPSKKLVKLPGIVVCLEATGIYHFDLSLALHDAGVLLMVVNPKASHNFAKVLMKNSKTDAVDANTLAEYAARMDFVAWTRPSDEQIALRSFARRINMSTPNDQMPNKLLSRSI